MGNSQQILIPLDFYKKCHKKLKDGKINQKYGTIQLYHQWKYNLFAIATYQQNFLLPKYFQDRLVIPGCSASDSTSLTTIIVGYDPYIYTLQNQIYIRRLRQQFFSNKELCKVMRACFSALSQWYHTYENVKIGEIRPSNVLFDEKGHIKLVNLFSFPPQNFINYSGMCIPYAEYNKIGALTSNKQETAIGSFLINQSIKQIGVTLFKMVCLFTSTQVHKSFVSQRHQMLKYGFIQRQIVQIIGDLIESNLISPLQSIQSIILQIQKVTKKYI